MKRRVPVPGSKVKVDNLKDVLLEGTKYLDDLKKELAHIKVPVRKDNQVVLDAIKQVFGEQYINSKGEAFITFDMYIDCMTIIRNVGRATAAEFAV